MKKLIQKITLLGFIFLLSACVVNTGDSITTESDQNNSMVSFENGDIMTSATEDPLRNKIFIPYR